MLYKSGFISGGGVLLPPLGTDLPPPPLRNWFSPSGCPPINLALEFCPLLSKILKYTLQVIFSLFHRLMSSFKHHFGVLRDHLLALLAQQDRDDDDIDRVTNQLGDAALTQLEQPDSLSDVFETINQCLVWMQPTGSVKSKGRGSGQGSDEEEEESESDSDEEVLQHKVKINILVTI